MMLQVLPLFKALADKKRIKIAALIEARPLSVEEIAAAVDLKPATVSHHLAIMREAGLVEGAREQYYTVYRFRRQPLIDALRAVAEQPSSPEMADNLDQYDQQVLRNYLEDGKLKSIPVQRKKRDAILRFLVGKFEVDRTYSEHEVNTILVAFHDDVATLRRELVEARPALLTRDKGRYWRVADRAVSAGKWPG